MKSTTKILIGILISGMVITIVGTILFCTIEWPGGRVVFNGELTQMDVSPFRVVNVSLDAGKQLGKRSVAVGGGLSVVKSVDGKNRLSYPKDLEHYLSVVTENDTLYLKFKISESKSEKQDKFFLEISKMVLTADSSLVAVQSKIPGFFIKLKKMEADSVSLKAFFINVDSCRFRSLSVQKALSLNLKNSCIHNTYLDLDSISGWSADSCRLENEYLTGSKRHYNDLKKGECRRMYWSPKKKDAKLNITLKEEACVSLPN